LKKRQRYRERLRKKILLKRSGTMKLCVDLLSVRGCVRSGLAVDIDPFLLLRELPADMKRLLCHPGPDTDRVVPAVQCADIFFSQSPYWHFSLPGSVTIFQAAWINVLTVSL